VQQLSAVLLSTKILTEKGNHNILDAASHSAGVRALVEFKAVRDSICIEDIMQFAGINS
jgi:indole-3-glycerol phosphate synthase